MEYMQEQFQELTAQLHLTPDTPVSALAPVLDHICGPHHGGYERGLGIGPHRQAARAEPIHRAGVTQIRLEVTTEASAQMQVMSDHMAQLRQELMEERRQRAEEDARRRDEEVQRRHEEEQRRREEEQRRRVEEEERRRVDEERQREVTDRLRRMEETIQMLTGRLADRSASH